MDNRKRQHLTPPDTATPPSAFSAQEGGDHYKTKGIQPVEYILANDMTFIEGCVVKYVTRWKDKGGLEDLRKARHFLDMLIEHTEDSPTYSYNKLK